MNDGMASDRGRSAIGMTGRGHGATPAAAPAVRGVARVAVDRSLCRAATRPPSAVGGPAGRRRVHGGLS